MIFSDFQKIGFWGILGPPSYGIGATIRIGRQMLCLPYAGFFPLLFRTKWWSLSVEGLLSMGPPPPLPGKLAEEEDYSVSDLIR